MRTPAVLMLWVRLCGIVLMLAGSHAANAEVDFLDPEVAFKFDAQAQGERSVEISFRVAPGYYLYREQFRFEATDASLDTPQLPPSHLKFDATFDKNVETYRDVVRITIPVRAAAQRFRLITTSQGCADAGLCYPPMQSGVIVSLGGFGGDGSVRRLAASALPDPAAAAGATGVTAATGVTVATSVATALTGTDVRTPPLVNVSGADSSRIGAALRGGGFWPVVGVFFLAGILLSLTPCVLPMLPIVASIIVGQGVAVTRRRGLALAAAYSFGMALVYTAFGVAAGLAGEGLAAALQTPWVLALFALGLIALALSMFGLYELRLPAAFTSRVTQASQRLPAGRIAGVCAMGGVSALIVSPCIAAPLAGALVYLSQTRDVWLGGTALFSLAAGMSVPLLLIGASAGALLPRAGAWMNEVKRFFGLLLLGVALWTVQTVLPGALVLALWGVLAIVAALLLLTGAARRVPASQRVWRGAAAAVLGVIGLLQWVGAAPGGLDPLQPLGHLAARDGGAQAPAMRFVRVSSVDELDAAVRSAGRPVMLDFYADWCVSCKEMERFTFSDAAVQQKLGGALLLKADVTGNTLQQRELLKRFQLFGPPGTIFFDREGREVAAARLVGFQDSARFLATLQSAGL